MQAEHHSAKAGGTIREKEGAAIPFAFSLVGFALAALVASLVAAKSSGLIQAAAKTLAIIFASLAGALVGFCIPLIPVADGISGSALTAGILGTIGTIGGMTLAENLLDRLEQRR